MNSSERKGLIVLIILILLLSAYRFIRRDVESRVGLIQSSDTAVPFAADSVVPADTSLAFQDTVTTYADTIVMRKHSKKSKSPSEKKQRKTKSKKTAPPKTYPTRNPLSEPV